MRKARFVAVGPACCAFLLIVAAAQARQLVALEAGFSPDKLNAPTTIKFGFHVSSSIPGAIPSPVVGVDVYLPAGMGLASSTLGLAVCHPERLLEFGLRGCPANSRVGFGTALGELSAEGELIREPATVQALVGPNISHHEQVLFYVESVEPVAAQLVFPGQLLPSSSPEFSGNLDTVVPLVSAWTDGPDVAVTQFSSSLGPHGLTYLRRVGGVYVPFKPTGIYVPPKCPRSGFPFRVDLTFLDASHVTALDAVPCPR